MNKALKGESIIFEWCFQNSDRKIFTEGNLYKVDNNGNSLLQLIIKDIKAKRKSEEQLKLLSFSIIQSSSAVIITDLNGNIQYVNDTFTNLKVTQKKKLSVKILDFLNQVILLRKLIKNCGIKFLLAKIGKVNF